MQFRSVAQVSIAITVGILVAAGAVVLSSGGTFVQALVWGVVLAVAARLLPILGSFAIACWPLGGGPPALGAAATTRMIARELGATVKLFFFFHPLQKLVTRHDPERVVPGDTPIVLVHGFYANAGFWHSVRRRLAADGWHNLFTLNLEPPFAGIDDYAAQLEARIEEVCMRCGADSVIVVAHSMGGLVARACARRAPGRIRHAVCLGSPHAGTILAALVPAKNTRQMRRGSEWLRRLNDGDALPVTNIYSEHDNIIVPQHSASLPGARNVPLTGMGHLEMAFSPVLLSALKSSLRGIATVAST